MLPKPQPFLLMLQGDVFITGQTLNFSADSLFVSVAETYGSSSSWFGILLAPRSQTCSLEHTPCACCCSFVCHLIVSQVFDPLLPDSMCYYEFLRSINILRRTSQRSQITSSIMDQTTSTPSTETWPPAWTRYPVASALRPYSTATVVLDGNKRSQPELWDICNGCILWLPSKADLGEIRDPKLAKKDAGFFDHPILVLDIEITDPQSAIVQFVTMTSRGKRPLSQLHPPYRDDYLPIFPAEPHPNSGVLLHLETESPKRGMIENSHVCIQEGVFSIDFRMLQCYSAFGRADGYRHRLSQDSFDQMIQKLGRSSSAWIETSGLWEEFLQKHVTQDGGKAPLVMGI